MGADTGHDGGHAIRRARQGDYDRLAGIVDDWWGRSALPSLPRLFLDHFHDTSLVATDGSGISGFLVGFLSPAQAEEAYIHFVAVRPDARKSGLGRTLYGEFFGIARARGRRVVKAITVPMNYTSIDFHRSLGFTVTGPVPDYNGPGNALVTFERRI
ncbi:N-acetyltransferase family protein [Nocardia thailandica]|uniref:GNAT family N-acetyltransferase n=1 Tax=Nocardia thailandica TaxID=257275 RepID=A0ABW6PGJ1_9NOCA|nr:GNAT family N-acetyltransferase [Nocardia thailandica]